MALFYGDPKRYRRNHRNYFVELQTTRQKAVRKIEKIHFFAGTVKAGGNLKKNLVFALCKTADWKPEKVRGGIFISAALRRKFVALKRLHTPSMCKNCDYEFCWVYFNADIGR